MVDFYTNQAADNFRLARSRTFVEPADGTYNILRIPKYTFVLEVFLNLKQACSGGSPSITIGFVGNKETADPDAFLTNTEAAPGSTGLKTSKGGTAAWADGKYFDGGSGAITLTFAAGGATARFIGNVFVMYSVVH